MGDNSSTKGDSAITAEPGTLDVGDAQAQASVTATIASRTTLS